MRWTALLLIALPTALAAQQVEPGTRVRVSTGPTREWSGQVLTIDDNAVTLTGARNWWGWQVGPKTIPLSSVQRLDVSRGGRSRIEGALWGAGMGLVSGAVGGAVGFAGINGLRDCDPALRNIDEENHFLCFKTSEALYLGSLIGAYFGVPSGALTGFAFPGDRWRRASPAARFSIQPQPGGGAALGASFTF